MVLSLGFPLFLSRWDSTGVYFQRCGSRSARSRTALRIEMRELCFIFVQTVSSSMFFDACAVVRSFFHTLFNKTVENFPRASWAARL